MKMTENFLEIADAIAAHPGAWVYLETREDDQEWSCGSTLPDQAVAAIRQQQHYLELAQKVIDEERLGRTGAIIAMKMGEDTIERYETALRSIAANTCCDRCREAALVAKKALGDEIGLEFTPKELELLWLALGNGAGDDAIDNLGLSPAEKKMLGAAANRIADAGKLSGPRFYE